MAKEKDKKPESLDDCFKKIHEDHSKDIEKAFELYDEHHKDENQEHIYNEIFAPAVDEFYSKFKEGLDDAFDKDNDKVYNEKGKLKEAAVKGLKAYFEKVQPGILDKALDGVDDIEDQYDLLIGLYEQNQGMDNPQAKAQAQKQGYVSLRELIEGASKDKDSTVGKIKQTLHQTKATYAQFGLMNLNQQATSKYFAGFQDIEVGDHVRDKYGLELDDVVKYKQLEKGQLIQLHNGIKDNEKVDYKAHGIKYVKPEKKDEG